MCCPRRFTRLTFLFACAVAAVSPIAALAQEVKTLAGHKEPVAAVAYSPDGRMIATGSFDKTIKLWDAKTLKEIKTLEGHTNLVLTLAFSGDSTKLISGGQDNIVKVWSVGPASELRALPASPAVIRTLAASSDGKLILAASDDGIMRLYDAQNAKPVRELKGHTGPIYTAVFTAKNAQIFSAGADRTIRQWEVGSGKELAKLEAGSQPVTGLDVLQDGKALFAGTASGQVKRFALPIQPIRTLAGHAGGVTKVAMHPDGKRVVSIGADKSVHVHGIADGKETAVIKSPAPVNDVATASANPNLVATAGGDKVVRVWNLADGKQIAASEPLSQAATAVAFAPDAKSLLVGEADGTIRAHAYPFRPNFAARAVLAHDAGITVLQRSTEGSMLLTAGQDKTVRLWNQDGTPIRAFAMFAPITHAALSPNNQLVGAIGANKELRVWTVGGQELRVQPNTIGPIAFSADGKWLATGGADNKVYLQPTGFTAAPKAVATHAGPIRSIAFTPQSDILLSASNDKSVKVTDVNAAKEIRALGGHQAAVTSLAISGDGKQVVSGGEDKTVRAWEISTGKATATLGGATGAITSVAVSGDGKRIAAASADNNIRVYENGALKATIANPSPVGVAFALDNDALVTASSDRNVRFMTASPPPVVGKHAGKVNGIVVTADGKLTISAGDDNHVRVWETASGKAVRAMAHGGPVTAVALSADGSKIVSGSSDKTCRVWNLADGKQITSLSATNVVNGVSISKDNKNVAYSSTDNMARVVSVAGVEVQTFTVGGLQGVQIAGDNKTVVTGSSDKLLRATTLSMQWSQQHKGAVTSIAATPNNARVVTASADNTIAARDANNGNVVKSIAMSAPAAVAAAADNVRIVAGGGDKKVRIFDINSGAAVQEYPALAAAITSVAYASDGKTIASADAGGTVTLWSTPQGKEKGAQLQQFVKPGAASACVLLADNKTVVVANADKVVRFYQASAQVVNLSGHKAQVYSVAFSPDGKSAASGGADNEIMIWDLSTNKMQKKLSGHKAQVYSVAYSKDGSQLVSGSGDKNVMIWDIAGGKAVKTLAGSKDAVYQVRFAADDKQIIGAGVDKEIHVWEVASGKEIKTLTGQPDEIYGMDSSPNGKRLATSGYAGTLVIWDIATAKPIHQQKLSFGAFDVSYEPSGAHVAVANNDTKTYLVELPKDAK